MVKSQRNNLNRQKKVLLSSETSPNGCFVIASNIHILLIFNWKSQWYTVVS
ncbi:hypothetical protein DAI22_04g035600 [Oryza sativa Japonica Group]|nr:hypothetical protein DAI22_04g035600 [Oryza sativa Japonica Group]